MCITLTKTKSRCLRPGTVRKQCGLSFEGSSTHENWVLGEMYIEGLDPEVLVRIKLIIHEDCFMLINVPALVQLAEGRRQHGQEVDPCTATRLSCTRGSRLVASSCAAHKRSPGGICSRLPATSTRTRSCPAMSASMICYAPSPRRVTFALERSYTSRITGRSTSG